MTILNKKNLFVKEFLILSLLFFEYVIYFFRMNIKQSNNYYKNVLVLAYLGDSVFTLMTREHLVNKFDYKPNKLNKFANSVVCAKNQAVIMQKLKSELTEEETDIVMRARNSHLNSKAKNSTLEEYSLATQFEALIGFWYLNGEKQKLESMFKRFVVDVEDWENL